MEYKIRITKSKLEKEEVFSKVKEIFFKTYGTVPGEPKQEQHTLYAEKEAKIIGSIGILFSNELKEMPFTKIFSFKKDHEDILNREYAYITGWVSEENNIGLFLSYCSGLYVLEKKLNFAFSILKPNVAQYLNKLSNNSWIKIEGLSINKANVRNEDINFFLSEPQPSLYYCRVSDCVDVLKNNKFIKEMSLITNIKFK